MKGKEEMGDEELVEIDEKDEPNKTKKDKEKNTKPISKSKICYSHYSLSDNISFMLLLF